ncbi:MAG: HEPN domain-containing protein [Clostridia bacterium]|nr:HEPN domain-containing protein [Clostridia bacterium]
MPDQKEREELARLRLQNAEEKTEYIPGIIALGDYKTAANRAYYAVFYAMRAVLALDGYDSKKHSGIISEFRKTYIKTGVFSEELSDIIGELFAVRTNSDYDDFYVLSKEKALAQYQNAVVFVDAVKKYFGEIGLL